MNYMDSGVAGGLNDTALPEGFWDDLPQPTFWRVLISPAKPKEVSKGGIVLATANVEAQEVMNYIGMVVAIGPMAGKHERLGGDGENPHPSFPKKGDYVMFGRYAGQTIMHKNRKLLIINDDEILGVVPNPETLQVSV